MNVELDIGSSAAAMALSSFTLALSGALLPGPMFSATIVGSHRQGFWFGPGVVVGHALAEAPVVALLLLGFATYLGSPASLMVIGAVGGIAMAWMGIGLVRQARHPSAGGAAALQEQGSRTDPIRFGAVPTGIITSVLNPYWYLWWVAFAPPLVALAQRGGWVSIGAFSVGHFSADLLWYSLTALGISSGRRFFQGRLYKVLLVACALILLVMAVMFLTLAGQELGSVLHPPAAADSP